MLQADNDADRWSPKRANPRRLSWIDLSDEDNTVGALKLTDPRWRRRFQSNEKSVESGEEEVIPPLSLPPADSTVDVTSLIRRRKKKVEGAAENKPASVEASGFLPSVFPDTTCRTMPAFRSLDVLNPEPAISNDDLNLLVNTLSQLTAGEQNPPTRDVDENYDFNQSPSQTVYPQATYTRNVTKLNWEGRPYCVELPHYPEDNQIVVNYHNLTHWRSLFLTLAFADPETLHAYVSSLTAQPVIWSNGPAYQRPHRAVNGGGSGQPSRTKTQQAAQRPPPSEGRFKQIARGKSTREYLAYVQAVPKDKRQEGIDPSTPRVEGSSWREFQAEVRAWKRMLHRRYEIIQAAQTVCNETATS